MALSGRDAPTMLKLADFDVQRYAVFVEDHVTMEDVMSPEFWVHVYNRLKVHDRIEAVNLGGRFDFEMRLVQKGPAMLKWRILREAKIGETGITPSVLARDSKFKAQHAGRGVYNVVEVATGVIKAQGMDKQGAEETAALFDRERRAA